MRVVDASWADTDWVRRSYIDEVQEHTTNHGRFSIMSHDVLKLYAGITNVVLKISAKNPPSGKTAVNDSILLGSHIDSTLPSPGAAE